MHPIALTDTVLIHEFVHRVAAPVNVLGRPRGPSVRQLEELGVAPVSFGPARRARRWPVFSGSAPICSPGDVDGSLASPTGLSRLA